MATQKIYTDPSFYEKKLAKVMERFGVDKYDWDYSRNGGWVEFYYKGQLYRFDHSVQNAQNHGVKLTYGSDAFAQIVLALEDLARIVSRGIYDLSNWVAGMKALPASVEIPQFFRVLGFDKIPTTESEIDQAYRAKAKLLHPDNGGADEDFILLGEARKKAKEYIKR